MRACRPASALQHALRTLTLAMFAVASRPAAAALQPAAPAPGSFAPAHADVTDALPDAPQPNLPETVLAVAAPTLAATSSSSSSAANAAGGVETTPSPQPILTSRQLDLACQSGQLRGKPCRAKWLPILWESLEATATQNGGNIALDDETRHDLVSNPFWSTYIKCVEQFRYKQWRDDDDFMVDYVGHGMQGAIAASVFEQNSPTGRGLVYVNNGNYWRSRLKGMAWIAVYEVQWKVGPASEASIGNGGLNTYYTPSVHGRTTNETGFQDFVDTPVVGFWWNVAEDAMDRFVMPHIWRRTHNKLILTALFPLTPCKAAANILRYKPFYYRDFPITPLR